MFSSSSDHIIVYHGTNLFSANIIQLYGINLHPQRNLTDFGKAFYVTRNLLQAKEWSHIKAENPQINTKILRILGINESEYLLHPDTKIPAYITFKLNKRKLQQLHGLIFPLPHEPLWNQCKEHWKFFVQNCRTGITHPYHFVYGPVGARHDGSFFQVKPTKYKEQLSLNTQYAIDCLRLVKVTPLNDKSSTHKKFNNEHREKRMTYNYFELNHPFLQQIVHILMKLGKLRYEEAFTFMKESWVVNEAKNRQSVIWQEPPAYWAHYLLYEDKKLWYNDYETYLIKERK